MTLPNEWFRWNELPKEEQAHVVSLVNYLASRPGDELTPFSERALFESYGLDYDKIKDKESPIKDLINND